VKIYLVRRREVKSFVLDLMKNEHNIDGEEKHGGFKFKEDQKDAWVIKKHE